MADPFLTPVALAAASIIHLLAEPDPANGEKQLRAGARKLTALFTAAAPAERQCLLRACHLAHIWAMESLVADAIALKERIRPDMVETRDALANLHESDAFRSFPYRGEPIPSTAIMERVDRMLDSLWGNGTDRPYRYNYVPFDNVFRRDLVQADIPIRELAEPLLLGGFEDLIPWHRRLRSAFGVALLVEPGARAMFTDAQRDKLRRHGVALSRVVGARLNRPGIAQADIETVFLRKMDWADLYYKNLNVELLFAFVEADLAHLASPDFDTLKAGIQRKLDAWTRFESAAQALEGRCDASTPWLVQARAAAAGGDFLAADALLARAGDVLDADFDLLLRARRDQRFLRASNASLAGNHPAAARFHEESVDVMPQTASVERGRRAAALQQWGEEARDPRLLREAIAHRRKLVRGGDQKIAPFAWAVSQQHLGDALLAGGRLERDAGLLREAVAVYRAALTVKKHDLGVIRPTVRNQLGLTLQLLAAMGSGRKLLDQAITEHRAALVAFTRKLPDQWAMTQSHLASAYLALARRTRDLAAARNAVSAFETAIEVFDRPELFAFPSHRGEAAERLAEARALVEALGA